MSNISISCTNLFLAHYYNILCNRRELSLNILYTTKCISPLFNKKLCFYRFSSTGSDMDVKQSWGFISISIGIVSLVWASISLSGMVGQEHVLLEMGSYIHASSTDFSNTNYAEKVMAAERHKNFVVLLSGLVMALLGSIMIKGRFNKF